MLYFSHNDAIDEQVRFSDSKLFLYKQHANSEFISNSREIKNSGKNVCPSGFSTSAETLYHRYFGDPVPTVTDWS